jgi:hypothetical protein
MKKQYSFYLVTLLSALLILAGCKKDKEPENILQIDDESFSLDWGIYEYYGTDSDYDGYVYELGLLDNGISYNGTWSGSGNLIWLNLASASSQGIASGTYTYDNTVPLASYTYDADCYWEIGWNTFNDVYSYIASGTVYVVNYGDDIYEVTVNCIDEAGNPVYAHYKGIFDFYDFTSKKAILSGSPDKHALRFIQK